MEFLTTLYENKKVKTACWTMVNSLIVIAIVAMGGINAVWVAPAIAILNMITKEINKKYL